jgi:hypothetical protein
MSLVMSTPTFRVTVRGFFDALTEPQRAALLAEADEHDILRASYTVEGHLTYDLSTRDAFIFRFLKASAHGNDMTDALQAADQAETAAATWLTHRGYGFKNLRSHAVDLADAPLSKRQRRAATRG